MPQKLIWGGGPMCLVYDPNNPSWNFWAPSMDAAEKIVELWNKQN